MHSINVTKSNEPQVRHLLEQAGIPFEVWEEPEEYSVISFQGPVYIGDFAEIDPLCVESGTHWDMDQIKHLKREVKR